MECIILFSTNSRKSEFFFPMVFLQFCPSVCVVWMSLRVN